MAVSVTLNGGGSIIAWQTPSGVSFQRFDASHQPEGAVTKVAAGPTAWLSASALANGGFSIIWDANTTSTPIAQNYDANGVANGTTYSVATPPAADSAYTSRAFDHAVGTGSPYSESATVLLPDGGSIVGSTYYTDAYGPLLTAVGVQRFDASGNELGSGYERAGFRVQWRDFSVAPMTDGGYAVGYVNYGSTAVFLTVLRFGADGTLLGTALPSLEAGPQSSSFVTDYELAGLPNGNFIVAWSQFGVLHVREYNAAGQPVTADQTSPFDADVAHINAIDVFPDGDYVVGLNTTAGIEYATFTSAGSPVPPADNDLISTIAPSYMLPVGPHDVKLIGSAAQSVTGNAFDNIITSNDFVSTLNGAGGNDTLIAGKNANILTGGPGADIFKFLSLPWNNIGHITDFAIGVDKLDFTALFASVGYSGSNAIADGYIRLQADGAGGSRLLFDSDGNGARTALVLVTTLDHVAPGGITATQLFNPSSNPPPPPPPTGGQTFTANGSRDQILLGGSGDDLFYTGHNSVIITGDGGADRYVFQYLPWNNTGHIRDFALGVDKLDFTALFAAAGYTGSNPVADGYVIFQSDGAGGSRILFDADGPGGNPWPVVVTTLDHVAPTSSDRSRTLRFGEPSAATTANRRTNPDGQ